MYLLYNYCRHEMVCLEHQLLLIAVERQKHMATIQHSKVTSSPSPLPPSTLSPLPTTLEDTRQPSLLFERCFAALNHMMQPAQSISDLVVSIPSQDTHDSHMTTTEATHDRHMTTTEETYDSHMTTYDNHMTTSETPYGSHMTTTEASHNSHATTTEIHASHDNHMPSEQLTSPDSGFPSVDGIQESVREDEEEAVELARGELVVLMLDKRRTEARHRRLGRKLMEIRTKKSQLQEVGPE